MKLSRCVRHDEEFHEHCLSCLRAEIKELRREVGIYERQVMYEEAKQRSAKRDKE